MKLIIVIAALLILFISIDANQKKNKKIENKEQELCGQNPLLALNCANYKMKLDSLGKYPGHRARVVSRT